MSFSRRLVSLFAYGIMLLTCYAVAVFLVNIRIPAKDGRPRMSSLVCRACISYLDFTKFASANGRFAFNPSQFSEYAHTNWAFEQSGSDVSTGKWNFTNEFSLAQAIRYRELYNSSRAIFNSNQAFWAKTNLIADSERKLVIVCKEPAEREYVGSFLGFQSIKHEMTYVAAYSDGSISFFSSNQFRKLGLSGFVPLSSLGVEGYHARFVDTSPAR